MSCYFLGQQHLTVQTMHGGGLQLAAAQGQPAIQVDQALTLELPSQPGEKKRRMACTCPNCKDADKRFVSQCLSRDFSSCIQSCDVDWNTYQNTGRLIETNERMNIFESHKCFSEIDFRSFQLTYIYYNYFSLLQNYSVEFGSSLWKINKQETNQVSFPQMWWRLVHILQ